MSVLCNFNFAVEAVCTALWCIAMQYRHNASGVHCVLILPMRAVHDSAPIKRERVSSTSTHRETGYEGQREVAVRAAHHSHSGHSAHGCRLLTMVHSAHSHFSVRIGQELQRPDSFQSRGPSGSATELYSRVLVSSSRSATLKPRQAAQIVAVFIDRFFSASLCYGRDGLCKRPVTCFIPGSPLSRLAALVDVLGAVQTRYDQRDGRETTPEY